MTTRRNFITSAAMLTATASVPSVQAMTRSEKKKLKILVTGAHPDDPETGMGGTVIKFSESGHDVVVLYFTCGEAGIENVGQEEAARIRKAEAEAACALMKARPVFFGQIDGSTVITPEWYERMRSFIQTEKPDLIFTHWPIDSHRDHRICSNLVYDAWYYSLRSTAFYYYEVCTGGQSQNFQPGTLVDISSVAERKWEACFIHKSQKIREYYPADHAKMEQFRGLELGVNYAEAFIRHWQSPLVLFP